MPKVLVVDAALAWFWVWVGGLVAGVCCFLVLGVSLLLCVDTVLVEGRSVHSVKKKITADTITKNYLCKPDAMEPQKPAEAGRTAMGGSGRCQ